MRDPSSRAARLPHRTALSEVGEAVLEVEAAHRLLALRAEGAPFWQRVRFEVHRRLLVESGAMDPPERSGSAERRRWMGRARSLYASLVGSAFRRTPRCDVLFAGGGRRVHDPELGWHAPYCGPVARACGLRPLVVEHFRGRWSPAAPGVPTRYLDGLYLSAVPGRIVRRARALPGEVRATLGEVRRVLHERTGVWLDLVETVERDLALRAHELPRYRRLLRRTGARVVVVECSYDKHTLLEAAASLGLPVVELQHGVMSRHHFGYHFPEGVGRAPIAPDWFLAWGEYWRGVAELPLPEDRVLAVGFPRFDRHLEAMASAGASGHARSDAILFLSQAMLGESLSRFAADLARQGLRERIVFRLHPRDEEGWPLRYPWLREAGVRVCGSEVPLYAQLASAPVLVGTFSTALFEGLGLGARLFLVPAPGIEYMDELVRRGEAVVACTPEELAARLRSEEEAARGAPSAAERFFRRGSLERACAVLTALASGRAPAEAAAP